MTETTTTTRTTARRRRGGEGAQAGSLCHYGLQFAGPRRGRRGWGATVVTVVTLLVVSACVGYLWHCVRAWMGTGWKAYATSVPGLAMWPVSGVIAWGVVGLCLALLVGLAVQGWRELTPREEGAQGGAQGAGGGAQGAGRRAQGEAQAGKPMLLVDADMFEAHGRMWVRHTPGDPCPVPWNTNVCVLLAWELTQPTEPFRASIPARLVSWSRTGDSAVIGWRRVQCAGAQAGKPVLLETSCPHCGKSMFVRREARVGGLARYGEEGAV